MTKGRNARNKRHNYYRIRYITSEEAKRRREKAKAIKQKEIYANE